MQLQPGERSILAYFTDLIPAEKALDSLQKAGFSQIHLSPVSNNNYYSGYGYEHNHTSISTMVLGHSDYDRAFAPLLASDPAVSGNAYSSYETNPSPGSMYILTVLTDNENAAAALKIIRTYGGMA